MLLCILSLSVATHLRDVSDASDLSENGAGCTDLRYWTITSADPIVTVGHEAHHLVFLSV